MKFGQWELQQDHHNWILIRHYTITGKKSGEPVKKTEQTYHRDLPQVANWLLNRETKESLQYAGGLDGLVEQIKESERRILESLKGVTK